MTVGGSSGIRDSDGSIMSHCGSGVMQDGMWRWHAQEDETNETTGRSRAAHRCRRSLRENGSRSSSERNSDENAKKETRGGGRSKSHQNGQPFVA